MLGAYVRPRRPNIPTNMRSACGENFNHNKQKAGLIDVVVVVEGVESFLLTIAGELLA